MSRTKEITTVFMNEVLIDMEVGRLAYYLLFALLGFLSAALLFSFSSEMPDENIFNLLMVCLGFQAVASFGLSAEGFGGDRRSIEVVLAGPVSRLSLFLGKIVHIVVVVFIAVSLNAVVIASSSWLLSPYGVGEVVRWFGAIFLAIASVTAITATLVSLGGIQDIRFILAAFLPNGLFFSVLIFDRFSSWSASSVRLLHSVELLSPYRYCINVFYGLLQKHPLYRFHSGNVIVYFTCLLIYFMVVLALCATARSCIRNEV
jgi:hypothetical protein